MLTEDIVKSSLSGLPKVSSTPVTPATENVANSTTTVTEPKTEPVKEEVKSEPIIEVPKVDLKPAIDDDSALAYLKSKFGIDAASLEDLVKKDEAVNPDLELSQAIDYGIKNGKLKLDDYNEAIKLQAIPPKELVFKTEFAKAKEKNNSLTEANFSKRFDRKYGEEVETKDLDENGEPIKKIVYDEGELNAEANKIIKNVWTPVENAKSEFNKYRDDEKFTTSIKREAEKIKTQIPAELEFQLGEKDIFKYVIDDDIKKEISDKVHDTYINYRNFLKVTGQKYDEKFDVAQATRDVVKDMRFVNMLKIYGSQQRELAKAEVLKPFEGKTASSTEPLEMIGENGKLKTPTETIDQIAQRFAKQVGR